MEPTAEPPSALPDRSFELPGHRLLRRLAETSLTTVYLAEDIDLGRRVVVKVLNRQFAQEPSFRERFRRETVTAARLDHPNIVPVYASGEVDGRLYLVLRYVAGGDLDDLLAEEHGRLGLDRTAHIVGQAAAALDTAHGVGLIHRDIKPGNILVDRASGHTYLTDFGIVKVVSARTLTATGAFLGTAAYAAPEQITGGPVDGRADLYALGCVAYQCLTGAKPFGSGEVASVLWGHLHQPVPRVTALRPDLDHRVDAIVAKAMAKRPEDRYATCGELADELARLSATAHDGEGRRTNRRVPRRSRRVLTAMSRSGGELRWRSATGRSAQRALMVRAAAVCLVVLVGIGIYTRADGGPGAADPRTTPPRETSAPAPAGMARVRDRTSPVQDKPMNTPKRGAWRRITRAPDARGLRTTCSFHDTFGSQLCVATGIRVPTSVWFENRSPGSFPMTIGVLGTGFDTPSWSKQTFSRPGTVVGAEWTGFPDDCYWGLIYFPDGTWGAKTHARVCVV